MTRKQGRKLVSDKPVARPKRSKRDQARLDKFSAEYMARVAALASRAQAKSRKGGDLTESGNSGKL